MTQINNFEQYNNYQTQQGAPAGGQPAPQAVRIPNYYYTPDKFEVKGFKETLKENPLYDMGIKQIVESPLGVLGTWAALSFGIDAYANACGGDYEKSLVKKASNLGDKIQNSKLIQNKPVQAVLNKITALGNEGSKLAQKSAILRAMKNTPSMPEWSMVKSQLFNQKQEIVQDFVKIADALCLDSTEKIKLKNIGLTDYEKDMLKKVFNVKKISEIPRDQLINQVLLNRLGRTPEEIKKIQALGDASTAAVKAEILKDLGLNTEKIKLIKEDVYGKYINEVEQAVARVRGRVKMGAGHYNYIGVLTKPFERTIGCDEIYNKLHSLTDKQGATATGRFMSKAMQMVHRGLTFGGGKLGALVFIAPILVEVAHNCKKADKDQKIGTVAGGFIDNISWVFTFPLALKMMHSLGGAQYAGMSKENVEKYRKILDDFNAKNKNGEFLTKADYKAAKKIAKEEMNKLSKVKGQNILTKGVRKLARFLTLDLETFKGWQGKNILMNKARQIPNFFKNVTGVPIRLAIWAGISMGVLDTAIKKCTSTVFGKSYDSMKEDEHKEEKNKQKEFLKNDLQERLYKKAAELQGVEMATPQNGKQGNGLATRGKDVNSNRIPTVVKTNGVDNYTYIPSSQNVIPHKKNSGKQDNYSYIPSSECTIEPDSKAAEKQRKYIPSQAAANITKSFDNSGLQSALDRAQRAEDKALRTLAGNFS